MNKFVIWKGLLISAMMYAYIAFKIFKLPDVPPTDFLVGNIMFAIGVLMFFISFIFDKLLPKNSSNHANYIVGLALNLVPATLGVVLKAAEMIDSNTFPIILFALTFIGLLVRFPKDVFLKDKNSKILDKKNKLDV